MIGTSDQSCWLAEACKILLLLLPKEVAVDYRSVTSEGRGSLIHVIAPSAGLASCPYHRYVQLFRGQFTQRRYSQLHAAPLTGLGTA